MQAGAVNIKFMADLLDLQAKMNQIPGIVGGAMNGIKSAVNSATGALAGLAAGFTVAAMAGWIKSAIDAGDAAGKMSAKTGVAVKDLAGLELAFKLAGVGPDGMVSSLSRLAKGISDNNIGLRALGINTRESNGELRSTSSVLRDVADKFVGMEDGTAKAALAAEIFGKNLGSELIPLLNGGSAAMDEMDAMAKKLGLSISDDAQANSEKFNDTMDLLQLGSQGVARTIAADLLPTLTNLAGSFLESMTEGDRLKNVAAFLSAGLKILYSVGVGIVEVFSTVGKTIGAVVAMVTAALRGDFAGAMSIGREAASDIGAGWSATARQVSAAWDVQSNSAVTSAVTIMKSNKDLLGAEKAREEAAKASGAASQKAAAEAAQLAAEGAKLAASLLAVESGLSGDFAKKWAELNAAYKTGAINLDVLVKAQAALLAQQPMMKAAYEAAVKASNEAAAARKKESDGIAEWMHAQQQAAAQSLASVRDRITGLRQEEQALALSRKLNISVAEAVEKLVIARMEEAQAAKFWEGSEGWKALQKEIDARKELLGVMSSQAVRQQEESGWLEIWNSVDRTAHDTFVNVLQGGQDLWSKLKNTGKSIFFDWLYQMTLKKWVFSATMTATGTAASVASAAGMDGGGSGGGLLGMASNASSLSNLGAIGGAASAFGGAFSAGAAIGTEAFGAGMVMMGNASGLTSFMAGAGQALGAIGPVGWVALAAIAAFALMGDDSIPSVSNGGTTRTYGADGKVSDETIGQWGLGNAGGITDQLASQYAAMQQMLMSAGGSTFSYGSHTGDNNENPEFRVSGGTGGKMYDSGIVAATPENMQREAARVILAALQSSEVPVSISRMLDALTPGDMSAQQIEEAIKSVATFIVQVEAMGPALEMMPLENLKGLSFDAAAGLVQAAGGFEKLNEGLTGYLDNFVTDGARRAMQFKQITAALNAAGAGLTLDQVSSAGRNDFAAFTDSVDVTTEEGARLYAALLSVQGAFAALTPELISVAGVTAGLPQIIVDGLNNADAAGAGQLFADTLIYGVQNALYQGFAEQITAIISDQLVSPMVTALATGASVSEAISGAAIESMVAQANAAAVALNAILTDPTFQSALGQISAAVSSAVAGSISTAGAGYRPVSAPSRGGSSYSGGGGGGSGASAADSIKSAWQAITDSIWGEVKRIRGLLEGTGAEGYAMAQARFAAATEQARAGDQDAAKLLPELSRNMLQLAENNVSTLLELKRIQGQTAGSLSDTGSMLAGQYGLNIPSFDVGTNFVPHDMLALIHQGEAIIPRPYNPIAANDGGFSNAALTDALYRVVDRLDTIEANTRAGAQHGGNTSRLLERAMPTRDAVKVRIAA